MIHHISVSHQSPREISMSHHISTSNQSLWSFYCISMSHHISKSHKSLWAIYMSHHFSESHQSIWAIYLHEPSCLHEPSIDLSNLSPWAIMSPQAINRSEQSISMSYHISTSHQSIWAIYLLEPSIALSILSQWASTSSWSIISHKPWHSLRHRSPLCLLLLIHNQICLIMISAWTILLEFRKQKQINNLLGMMRMPLTFYCIVTKSRVRLLSTPGKQVHGCALKLFSVVAFKPLLIFFMIMTKCILQSAT
jgi:hypothetical protein